MGEEELPILVQNVPDGVDRLLVVRHHKIGPQIAGVGLDQQQHVEVPEKQERIEKIVAVPSAVEMNG